ncbi:Photosynthesis system II assembly factor Ycf48/Hcf136-like domain protein [Raphanus sativus]|uniref:Uncharacterized protein LOC108823745 n=1 Tax=Raphanus sativus TaxID=3726 RepID=A0A9W3D0A2_RAPSA|nr:uncharacterized protein LOC108823745 [Raphanus sativus]KAJ4866812.1 Photosynthesis system II assembly factor Ycf48/Hcf136-like domain protein [Raphanus sativus]
MVITKLQSPLNRIGGQDVVPTQSANLTPISHLYGAHRVHQCHTSLLSGLSTIISLFISEGRSMGSRREWDSIENKKRRQVISHGTVTKAADSIVANLYEVKFVDDKKGFVLGYDGVLLGYVG